jgi:single-stranded-DNA-specific exonuclease
VTELTAQALWHRGFRTPQEAQAFLHPEDWPIFLTNLQKQLDEINVNDTL